LQKIEEGDTQNGMETGKNHSGKTRIFEGENL